MQCLRLSSLGSKRRLMMTRIRHSPYDVLGIGPAATKKEIKQAYRDMVKQCHPDLHPDDPSKAAQFRKVQEAYEAVRDAKPSSATGSKRPFRQQQDQQQQQQQQKWHPGMDHEHNWQQRMKIRQEWERQGRQRKDRERKRYADQNQAFESQYDRARRAHHRMNDARYQFEADPDLVEQVRREKRAEYEAWMRRREKAKSFEPSGPVTWLIRLAAPFILSGLLITSWAEWQQGREDAAKMHNAQFRSMLAWNRHNRDQMKIQRDRQNELIEQSNEQLNDVDASILDVLEHNSKILQNRRNN